MSDNMPSGQQIALYRKVDPDFSKYYDATPYGDKALFLAIYKDIFEDFYGMKTSLHSDSACKPIVIDESLPEKYREKYFLKPGDKFKSLTDLKNYCNCTTVWHWPRYGWTKHIKDDK